MRSSPARQESCGAPTRQDQPDCGSPSGLQHPLSCPYRCKVRPDYRPVNTYTRTDDIEYVKPKARVY